MAQQQMLLGAGKPPTKYYIDDVFSMDPYLGKTAYPYNVLGNVITTGLKIKDEGGFVWIKNREGTQENLWFSPAMGVGKNITPASAAAMVTQGNRITQYKDDGFKLASDTSVNENGKDLMSWSFKNNKGFFELVEWTGNGTARTISHGLGCKPGFIAVKSMSQGGNWTTWHRGMNKGDNPHNYYQRLNVGGGLQSDYQPFTAEPTSTGFAIIADNSNDYEAYMNKSGETYKAWVWAGGESDAATARSVSFSSSSTYLSIPDSNDFDFGSTFTFEAWVKPEFHSGGNNLIFEHGSFQIAITDTGRLNFDLNHVHIGGDFHSSTGSVPEGQWTHVAVVGTSGTLKMYINGVNDQNANRTGVDVTGDTGAVTISDSTGYYFKGEISNLRIVKGTAVYASSFRPPTEPLTNITNTVLLCCNNSSTTGSTVTPGTITANGSPTASTDSPFDDPGNFIFGSGGDQNVIKTGYYIGNGDNTNGLEVELGFEPQFLWIKADGTTSDANYNWLVFDTMRTMDNRKHDNTHDSGRLYSSNNGAEVDTDDGINVLPTGFKIQGNNDDRNGDGHQYIYIAIRASEGYVSKVPEAGSDVFAMDTGNSSTDEATFDSGFPVDFGLKRSTGADNWGVHSRLMGKYWLTSDSSATQYSENGSKFDSAVGMLKTGNPSSVYGWMWKRHAGCDVVTYVGNGVGGDGRQIPHSMNSAPEMIITKARDVGYEWPVWHTGLSAIGNNLRLNGDYAELSANNNIYGGSGNALPTATHWTVGSHSLVNANGNQYFSILLSSVEGISKVGSYAGASSNVSVTTGFQPRFIIIKRYNNAGQWAVFDTLRGITSSGSNGDKLLYLNATNAQTDGTYIELSSTGFTVNTGWVGINGAESEYIYYAHA